MKIAFLLARLLLGLMFTIFGLNGFFHFIPMGPMPAGPAGQFLVATSSTHYLGFVYGVQLVCGVLFLIGRFVPLALALLGPVLVNILLFHFTMEPHGFAPGLLATLLWFVVFFRYRAAFAGMLRPNSKL